MSNLHGALRSEVLQNVGPAKDKVAFQRVRVSAGANIEDVRRQYLRNPGVRYVEPNYVTSPIVIFPPNDPFYNEQWGIQAVRGWEAWETFPGQFFTAANRPPASVAVRIAILDTGIDPNHPDFINAGGSSTNINQGGQLDLADGWDFINNDANPWDDHGHGTLVAGIIGAAADNGIGIAGLAYSEQIMPVKVIGSDGLGPYSAMAAGIYHAVARGAVVINISFGGTAYSQALQDAVTYAWDHHVMVIAAAGNDGETGSPRMYPAANNHVIGVGAATSANTRASFSSIGSWVALTAPGENILSTMPTYPVTMGSGWQNNLAVFSGTSLVAPWVTGGVALLIAEIKSWAPPDSIVDQQGIRNRIEGGVNYMVGGPRDGCTDEVGFGGLNLHRSLTFWDWDDSKTLGCVTGAVNGLNGLPVGGATVRLVRVSDGAVMQTVTYNDGTYRIRNVLSTFWNGTAFLPGSFSYPAQSVAPVLGSTANATFNPWRYFLPVIRNGSFTPAYP